MGCTVTWRVCTAGHEVKKIMAGHYPKIEEINKWFFKCGQHHGTGRYTDFSKSTESTAVCD